MKINNIQNYTNLNKTQCQKNNVSFGTAYDLNQWNKTFDNLTEDKFLNSVVQKIQTKSLKLVGRDGLTYKFKTPTGSFIYTKESKGMMANFKYIPNNEKETGFYIINNGISPLTAKISGVTNYLDNEIKRQVALFRSPKATQNKVGHTVIHHQQILRNHTHRNVGNVAYYLA